MMGKVGMERVSTEHPSAPLVSVLVPTYQHAAYIAECLDGILMQRTGFPIEVLVGEDGSTDGTREICQRYAAEHPERIKLHLFDRKDVIQINGRPTGRWNLKSLIAAATGRYIALCEGDDHWIDPLKLQKQVDLLERDPSVSLVFHNTWIKHEASRYDRFLNRGLIGDRFTAAEVLSREWFVGTASICARSECFKGALDGFDFAISGDLVLQYHAALRGDFHYLDEVASVYRRNDGGVSESFWSAKKETTEIQRNHFEVFRPNQIWLLQRLSKKVKDQELRAVVNKRIGSLMGMVMKYRIRSQAPDTLITIEDLSAHARGCLLKGAPSDAPVPELGPGSELGALIEDAALSVWGQQARENLRAVAMSGRPLASLRLCVRMLKARLYSRRELAKWAVACVPWSILGLLGGKKELAGPNDR